MLVLSRRSQQAVLIGGRVKVTVLSISHSYVELGIEAPPHIAIDREEVHLRKVAEKSVVRLVSRVSTASGAASTQSATRKPHEPTPPAAPRGTRTR